MNLDQAISSSELRVKSGHLTEAKKKPQLEVAQRVFEVSAMAGEPYEAMKPEDWAKRWLVSKTFVLAEITPDSVAVPNVNRISKAKVEAAIYASAEQIEPIVVDINKNGIGATDCGYIPKVVVLDGKNRHRAQVLQRKDKILAWVGEDAMAILKRRSRRHEFKAAAVTPRPIWSKGDSVARLYAAIAGPAAAIRRQDTGDGGSRPTGGTQMPRMNSMGGGLGGGSGMNPDRKGIFSQNARSSGQLDEADPSDTKATPDAEDENKTFPDPSDRRQWQANKPQLKAPGADYKPFKWANSQKVSPGSGVGPMIKAGPIKVKRIVTSPKKGK